MLLDTLATASAELTTTSARSAKTSRPAVAAAALTSGEDGLSRFQLQVGRPIGPMLAQTAASTDEALSALGEAAFEWKLDGVRIQVHRSGSKVTVFTRTLDDITGRLPDVADAFRE